MKETIGIVHPREVTAFFRRLGLEEELHNHHLRCGVCGQVISEANFKSALQSGGKLFLFCSQPSCEPDEVTTES